MNSERILTVTYFALGVAMGILSIYLGAGTSVGIGAVAYAASFFISKRFIRGKKFSWYILNTLLTYVLVWLVTWIFLFNL